jgi:hypothetical protein
MKSIVVVFALLAAIVGAVVYFASQGVKQELQPAVSIPAEASVQAAQADVGEAVPVLQEYSAANGTYASATIDGLRELDAGISSTLSLHDLTTTSFCVQSNVGTSVASSTGPGGSIVDAACP